MGCKDSGLLQARQSYSANCRNFPASMIEIREIMAALLLAQKVKESACEAVSEPGAVATGPKFNGSWLGGRVRVRFQVEFGAGRYRSRF